MLGLMTDAAMVATKTMAVVTARAKEMAVEATTEAAEVAVARAMEVAVVAATEKIWSTNMTKAQKEVFPDN